MLFEHLTNALGCQEDAATARGVKNERWLVIGSKWDHEKGKWGVMAGHMSTPGDAWSKTLGSAHDELESALSHLRTVQNGLQQEVVQCDPQKQMKLVQAGRKELKAQQKKLYCVMKDQKMSLKEMTKEHERVSRDLKGYKQLLAMTAQQQETAHLPLSLIHISEPTRPY